MSPSGRPSKPAERSVLFGSLKIPFHLSFQERKTLSITVHPDHRVTVVAPDGLTPEQIDARVRRKASWILRQMDLFANAPPPPIPRNYISGETWIYLGRQYRLKVVRAEVEEVKLAGQFFWLFVSEPADEERKRTLLAEWFRRSAHVLFQRRLDALAARMGGRIRAPLAWRIQTMKARWGSCSPRGLILLNPLLIHAPLSSIDYVLAHELCHRSELNHTPKFFRLLSALIPDWYQRKERLDRAALH